jgi:hypothetical protein
VSLYSHLNQSLSHPFSLSSFHLSLHEFLLFAVRENWEQERIVTLMCIDAVDKKYREKEHDANRDSSTSEQDIAYKRYMANNGVHPLMMRKEQADYLDTFSNDAQLFYLAFCFVDGTDGIANGVGRHILSYVGIKSNYEEGDGGKRGECKF